MTIRTLSTAGSITAPNLLAVICVYADYHRHLVDRAAASVAAQTLPCLWVAVEDQAGVGPALGRNAAAESVPTPFVTFLDADDTLAPNFAEAMLNRWQPGHYVYSDWHRGEEVHVLPDRFPAYGYQLHLNTCVIRRELFLTLGGYQTQMEFEDTEFWFRAMSRGVCGIRCPLPLVEYSADGRRSAQAREGSSPDYLKLIYERYGDMAKSCCGGEKAPLVPTGTQQPGDVQAQTLWGGNFVRHGLVTRREYPRSGDGKIVWMDPRDALAAPQWYRIIEQPIPQDNGVSVENLKAQIARLVNRA